MSTSDPGDRVPSPGDLLLVDGRASVQFAGDRALRFRVVSVSRQPTYPGWVWLTGYVLNRRGEAAARREVYVQLAGLRRHPAPRPVNASGDPVLRGVTTADPVSAGGRARRP
ncbi:hypothetical protein GA0070609_1936 [Micromonospora echinaurantiaca]|uniref:Uncharacterized protein n=1 Tax=Micromonospora echinaurantiaca TaxID=47857 RepID=A0A1C5HNB6_9ACTN|nr:hypothetical protein [Micromonospora echinaurantiaca]SCG47514.1 hypothetical protein GA0070609_1936 [Micromonospora echinaurantiaca]